MRWFSLPSAYSCVCILSFSLAALGVIGCGVTPGPGEPRTTPSSTLVSIAVTPAAPSITVGSTQQFTAMGTYSDGSTKDITSSATWTSSNAGIASVSSSGLATALAPGASTFTAKSGSVSGSATLTVTVTGTATTLVSIAVNPANVSLAIGATQQFTVIGTYSDNSTADLTSQATWSETNSNIASLNTSGMADALRLGFTKVVATVDGISGAGNLAVVGTPRYLYDLSDAGRDISRLTIDASTGQPRYLGYQTTKSNNNLGFGCITIDPSAKYAYVTTQIAGSSPGTYAGQVTAYSMNSITGALTLMPGSPYTLSEAIGCLHFLPNGNFAYATPGIEEATNDLVTLTKDSTGKLAIIGSITLPSVPAGFAMDQQGKFLYVATEAITPNGESFAYGYAINSTTGALTPIDGTPLQLPNNTYGLFSFNPSGDFLYMADSSSNIITDFSVDRSSGALTGAGAVSLCVNPDTLQFSPTGKYAFDICGNGGLVSFSVAPTGQLTQIGIIPTQPGFQTITVDPSGQFLYENDHLHSLSTYKIAADGSISLLYKTAGRVLEESIAFLPGTAPVTYTTQSAYLTSSGDSHLTSYTVNTDGTLTQVQTAPTLQSPFSLTTLPWASDLLLASNAAAPNLQAYTATNSAGAFTPGYTFGSATSPGGLIMDPSGSVAFSSDSSTGLVHPYGQVAPGNWGNISTSFTAEAGAGPLAMDPSGRYLFVANKSAKSISEFEYAGAAPVPAFPLSASPLAICTGPTGNHLFVAGDDNQLRMLTVDPNGILSDTFDISLPATPTSVAIEPTGHTIYVTSASGISAFTINQQAGTLTALPLSISVALANATGVFIDPSGKYLYVSVSSSMDNALYLFTINSDGTLSSSGAAPVATPDKVTSMVFHTQIQ